jgi:hypothetical protein
MAHHMGTFTELKAKIDAGEIDPSGKDQSLILKEVIHAADLGNQTKPFNLA